MGAGCSGDACSGPGSQTGGAQEHGSGGAAIDPHSRAPHAHGTGGCVPGEDAGLACTEPSSGGSPCSQQGPSGGGRCGLSAGAADLAAPAAA
eukprot:scaffold141777_cov10-Tisochrysis_lutea.AAC.1